MKMKISLINLFVWVTGLFFMNACSGDDNPSPIKSQIESNVQQGSWQITKFIDSGSDETNHFNGYTFTFASSGVLQASNGTTSYAGIWSISDSNSNDDSQDDLEFIIYFNLTNDFEELNEDWEIITQSTTKIELIHISGGGGGTDYLTFEKK
jgi:hypothetical protein